MEENWAGCPGRGVFRDSWQTLASLKYLTVVWSPFQLFLFWSFEEWKSGGFHPHSVTSQTGLQRGLHWTWKGCDPKGAVVYWERVRGRAWPGAWPARSPHAAPCCRTIAPVLWVARKQTHRPAELPGVIQLVGGAAFWTRSYWLPSYGPKKTFSPVGWGCFFQHEVFEYFMPSSENLGTVVRCEFFPLPTFLLPCTFTS